MPLRLGTPMPSLAGATSWLNSELDLAALAGHPVLVHFWAISCHICHENMPTICAWRDLYAPRGLRVVAIHVPRQEADMDLARVEEDIKRMCVTEPCGMDNTHAVTEAFDNTFVPAYFLFDAEGKLAGRAAGYAGLTMIQPPLLKVFPVDAG